MKNSKLILVLGLVMVVSVAFGQDYAFKVLANKGSNEVKSGDSWQAIKTGASLKSADEVRISENAYLGLIHATGKPIEIKQAGSYKVADLAAQVQGGGASVLNKYTDFILSSNSAEAKKNRLSATGAVHRGAQGGIELFTPANQYSGIINSTVVVQWEEPKGQGPYVVTFRNMFDDELMKIETPEEKVTVDLGDPKLANESAILFDIHAKSNNSVKSETHMVKKLSPADQERLKKEISETQGAVSKDSAMGMYYMAQVYEKNQLYLDAIAAYEEAIKMAPDVTDFKEGYEDFLKFRLPKD